MLASAIKRRFLPLPILATSLLAVAILSGANLFGPGEARPNGVRGTRVIGLARELLLASPIMVGSLAPPVPAPLQSLEELATEGAWLPAWLPADVQAGPVATTHTTVAGDRVLRIEFQILRAGERRPVMIIQVDGPSENGLAYAPPPPAWLDRASYGVASVTQAKLPAEAAEDATALGGREVRRASYEPAAVNGHVAQAISLPSIEGPTLHGLLWQVGRTWLYVGGYLPADEIHAIAEGMAPGPP